MKRDALFQAIYRRGYWVHGALLSVGTVPNHTRQVRVGFRVKRGVRHATDRNRLKRQLRHVAARQSLPFKGADLLIVIHPRRIPVSTRVLEHELVDLCQRLNQIS